MIAKFKISKKKIITEKSEPYIIAEACINHEGNIKIAKKMIDEASNAGASAIKFQFHVLEDEMLKVTPKSDNFKETLYKTLDRTNLNIKEHIYLKNYCKKMKIDYLCTPFSFKSADILEKEIKLNLFKVGSGELTNIPLQIHIAKKNKPTIISTGMSTMKEVEYTFNKVYKINKNIALTQCTSSYPCDPRISDLKVVNLYSKKFKIISGLSDHTSEIYTSLGAIALGAKIIEKHFTLNKRAKGPDHASSLEPHELKQLVKGSKDIFYATINNKKIIHKEERQIIKWARESVVSIVNIKKGDLLDKRNISVKRPAPTNKEIPAKDYFKLLGKKAKTNIIKNRKIKWHQIK